MEPNSLTAQVPPVDVVWPPPSAAQSPVYEFRLNHAMIRSRSLGIRFYQPNFWRRKLEVSEHGLKGFLGRSSASYLPWSDIEAVTIAPRRRQICIFYHYPTFGFKAEIAQIFSANPDGFDLLGVSIKRFAKCAVVEDDEIYWSYSKLMLWYSVFWMCELSLIYGNHHGQWAAYWKYALAFLNHLVSLNPT